MIYICFFKKTFVKSFLVNLISLILYLGLLSKGDPVGPLLSGVFPFIVFGKPFYYNVCFGIIYTMKQCG